MAKSKTKKRFSLSRAVAVCMLVPAVYVGVQVYRVTRSRYEYETAIRSTLSDSIEAQGLVVFQETPVEGSGDLGYLVSNGERVSAGTQVAEVYTDASQADLRTQISTLDAQISLLEKSQNTSTTQVDTLLAQRSTAIYSLLDMIDYGQLTDVQQYRQDYLLAQNRLQITTGEISDFSAQITQLRDQEQQLQAQMGQLQTVSAPVGGYFVSAANARSYSLSPDEILALSAADLNALLQEGADAPMDGMAGKIVSSYSWEFCGICTLEQSAKFDGLTSVKISFPGKAGTELPAQVVSVEKDEANGIAKFTLSCENIGEDILSLGQEKAQITFHTYSGIRISAAAVHLVRLSDVLPQSAASEEDSSVSAASDSAASPGGSSAVSQAAPDSAAAAGSASAASSAAGGTEDFVSGVYVKYGSLARFRRITELYEENGYILVPDSGALGTDNEVRLYDEIIVAGSNLYDGKLL